VRACSKTEGGGEAGGAGHVRGGDDDDVAAALEDKFGEVVEEIVAVRAGDETVGFDEEGIDAGGSRGVGDVLVVVGAEGAGVGGAVGFGVFFEAGAELGFDDLPGALAEVGGGEGPGVGVDAVGVEEGVVADVAERGVVLGEGGEDEGHAGGAGVVFEDGAVDGAEEAFFVDVGFVGFGSLGVAHVGALGSTAVGGDGFVGFGVFCAEGFGDVEGNAGGEGEFVELVAVAVKEADLAAAEGEDLVAFGGLLDAEQGFEMEAGGHGGDGGDGALEFDGAESGGVAEDGETVPGVGPEGGFVGEGVEGRQEAVGVRVGVVGGEIGFELLDEVLVADGVLLVFGVATVSGQVDREAGAVLGLEELVELIGGDGCVHKGSLWVLQLTGHARWEARGGARQSVTECYETSCAACFAVAAVYCLLLAIDVERPILLSG
jgi:hypothetical protein